MQPGAAAQNMQRVPAASRNGTRRRRTGIYEKTNGRQKPMGSEKGDNQLGIRWSNTMHRTGRKEADGNTEINNRRPLN